MSASLVGSEMCIRDRSSSATARATPSASTRAGCARPSCASSGQSRPVSYTHLTLPTICSV
eukprot:108130-Alexandrium_andersonii.AAC.1